MPQTSDLDGISVNLPALTKAFQLNEVACRAGFDWNSKEDRWKKVEEEIQEFRYELLVRDTEKMEMEFGDLLLILVKVAAAEGIDAETALHKACEKFRHRFRSLEQFAEGKSLKDFSLNELEEMWQKAKVSN